MAAAPAGGAVAAWINPRSPTTIYEEADIVARDKIISAVWAVLTLAMTANCVYVLVSDGTTYAWILALTCATFPIVSWTEAAKFRARGASDAAQAILGCAVLGVAIFMFLATYCDRARDECHSAKR